MPNDNNSNTNGNSSNGFGGGNAGRLGQVGSNNGNNGNSGQKNGGNGNSQGHQNGNNGSNGQKGGNSGGASSPKNNSGSKGNQFGGDFKDGQGSKPGASGAGKSGGGEGLDSGTKGSTGGQKGATPHMGFGSNHQGDLNRIGQMGDKAAGGAVDSAKDQAGDALKNGTDDSSNSDNPSNGSDNVNGDSTPSPSDLGKQVNNGGVLPDGLKNLGQSLPKPMQKAGSKLGKAYGKFNNQAVKGVFKAGSKFGLKHAGAQAIVHAFMATGVGLGAFGVYNATHDGNTLHSTFVCTTKNDSANNYIGDGDLSDPSNPNATEEAGGDWTKKGTKSYDYAKRSFQTALNILKNPKLAAAVVGNGVGESNYAEPFASMAGTQYGGGKGKGFYQFSVGNAPADMSPEGQTTEIIKEGGHQYNDANSALHGQQLVTTAQFKKMNGSLAYLTNTFLISFEAAGDPRSDVRIAAAYKALELFGDLTPAEIQSSEQADSNTANAEKANNTACNTDGYGLPSDGNIVKMAQRFNNKIPYSQGARNTFNPETGTGSADCSSFVWAIFKASGYEVPDSPWNTVSMVDGSNSKYLKIVPAKDAKPGDAFVINKGAGYGDNGHTGILTQAWHGDNTMVINEGGSQGDVNTSTFSEACYDALLGGKIQFVRPTTKK